MSLLPRKSIRYGGGKELPNVVSWVWLWFTLEYESAETHYWSDPRKPATNKPGWWWAHNQDKVSRLLKKLFSYGRKPKVLTTASVSVAELPHDSQACDHCWADHLRDLGNAEYVKPIHDLHSGLKCLRPKAAIMYANRSGNQLMIEPSRNDRGIRTSWFILLGGPKLHDKKFRTVAEARAFIDTL